MCAKTTDEDGRVKRPSSRAKGKKRARTEAPDGEYLTIMDTIISELSRTEESEGGGGEGYRYGDVLVLDAFASHHGFDPAAVTRTVSRSGFFNLEDILVKHGTFFVKETTHKGIVAGTGEDLERALRTHPLHVAIAASRRDRLLREYRKSLDDNLAEALKGAVRFPQPVQYQAEPLSREHLMAGYDPGDEGREARQEAHRGMKDLEESRPTEDRSSELKAMDGAALAGIMRRKLPRGKEFTFPDGTVARSLETWARALATTPDGQVREMLLEGKLEGWLASAGRPGLAAAAAALRQRLEAAGESDLTGVKARLFRRMRESGMGGALFAVTAEPLVAHIQEGKGDDPEGLVEAVVALGGRQATEPLIGALFTSRADMRRAVIRGLGELGDRRAVPNLVKLLEFSLDPRDRLEALEALGKLGASQAMEAVVRASEGKGEVARRARKLLNGLADGEEELRSG
jgi:hypothetical protein